MALHAASTYLEKKILNHTLGVEAYAMPVYVEVGLFTSNPGPLDTGNEVPSDRGYFRLGISFSPAEETSAGTGPSVCKNSSSLIFGPCTNTAWGVITHIGLYDNIGNLLYYAALTEAKTINVGDTLIISPEQLIIRAD
jgi:hypothetical protein